MKTLFLSFCAILLISVEAQGARRDQRQASQRSRIQQGVQSGELTRREAVQLRAQQRHIRRAERRAEADGVVTLGEKARIENKQDRASKNIFKKKHNEKDRDVAAE